MNYENLENLPRINNVTVIGRREIEDFGFVPMNPEEIDEIFLEIIGFVF